MHKLIEWIRQQPQQVITILAAIIGGLLAIVGGLFTIIIWPLVRVSGGRAWDRTLSFFTGRAFENVYLDWLLSEHQFLPILPTTLVPVSERRNQELDKLYVALTFAGEHATKQDISLAQALNKNRRLVILGDPGAGKTTMLRFLTLTFARARRGRSVASNAAEAKDIRSRVKAARARVKEEFGMSNRPIPIFIYLNRLRDVGSWPKERSLLDVLRDELKSVDRLRDFPEDFFKRKLDAGQCLFLFDAFDELGTQEARGAIARRIGELANASPQGNRFIVTSRIVGYSGQLGGHGFDAIKVEPLSWDLIEQLITKWYSSLNESSLADQLLDTLRINPRILELAVNPMLLSLIVLVQYVKRLIPDRRHILYEECVKILVERRYAPPPVQEAYNAVLPSDDALTLLRHIAIRMHNKHLREIPRDELEDQVLPELMKDMAASRAAGVPCSEVLKNIEQRSQLLVERGINEQGKPVMAFSHLTFQEYLVAFALKEMMSVRGRLIIRELLDAYDNDPKWWEEVTLLFAAQLGSSEQDGFLRQLKGLNQSRISTE